MHSGDEIDCTIVPSTGHGVGVDLRRRGDLRIGDLGCRTDFLKKIWFFCGV